MGKSGSQKVSHQLTREFHADDSSPENEHIDVIVLDSLTGGVCIVAKSGANAGKFVGRNACTHAAAADEYAAFGATVENSLTHRFREIRIIDGGGTVRPDVDYVMAELAKKGSNIFLELESGVIGADNDSHRFYLRRARARSTTWPAVKPNFSITIFPGADAPNRSIPMISPLSPVYLCQPRGNPASTAIRRRSDGGSTESRYSGGWVSNNSQLGIDTSRARTLCCRSFSCASTISDSSDPVAMSMISGLPSGASLKTYAPPRSPCANGLR